MKVFDATYFFRDGSLVELTGVVKHKRNWKFIRIDMHDENTNFYPVKDIAEIRSGPIYDMED